MLNTKTLGMLTLAALLLIACGGTSDRSKTTTPPNGPGNTPVTSANLIEVVRGATEAMMRAHAVFAFAGGQGDEFLVQSKAVGRAPVSLMQFAWLQWSGVSRRVDLYASAQAASNKALVSLPVVACAEGGSLAVDFADLDNNNLPSSGDGATFVFTNCSQQRVTANGTMVMSNVVISGIPSSSADADWRFAAQYAFTALSVTQETGTQVVNGAASVEWRRVDANTESGALSMSNLSVQEDNVITVFASAILNSLDSALSLTSTMSMSGDVRVGNSAIMTVATPTPILMIKDSGHPSLGDVTIRMSPSLVKVMTRDSITVDVELDADGNNTLDGSVRTSWQQIHNIVPDIQT